MKEQKLKGLLDYLAGYIRMSLDELKELRLNASCDSDNSFLLGETYAFLDCLEIIMFGFDAEREVLLEFEKKYGVN